MTGRRGGRRISRHEIDATLRRLFPAKPWTGAVERRDPSTYREPSEVMIRRCGRIGCGHWTPKRLRLCVVCHQPRLETE